MLGVMSTQTPRGVSLPPLPYADNALEPYISARTLEVHHGRHHAAYVARTQALIAGTALESASLEEIVRASAGTNPGLFNAAAQAWNHDFFWRSMRPGGGGEAHGEIARLIRDAFGSQEEFGRRFTAAAADLFGSGWVWLVLESGALRILQTSNAETPLVSGAVPLLTLDVWEHAYYLDYQNRRADYIAAFLGHLLNWDFANEQLGRTGHQAHAPQRSRAAR